jgi:hypothetical protein
MIDTGMAPIAALANPVDEERALGGVVPQRSL